MEIKTYQARTMHEALELVRRELGPDAAVLHTREVHRGMLRWIGGGRRIEVVASREVRVPSRMAKSAAVETAPMPHPGMSHSAVSELDSPAPAHRFAPPVEIDYRARYRDQLRQQSGEWQSPVEDLANRNPRARKPDMPQALFRLFTDLLDAEVGEDLARELIDRVRTGASPADLDDPVLLKARVARMIEDEIEVGGPLRVTPGHCRVVALVGPTGVGKTTTIAKLAANFRLREKQRVGLITVDTYRIAAVEQLRTYADIIDLPMEVVSTPRQMREAVARLADLDLVLLDTAGRSPRDEVKIQELKSMLAESRADEVHLVLSATSSASSLARVADQFAVGGTTSLILTKLDEATGLGNLLPLVRRSRLPLSYVTNGQNVPDDIEAADRRRLTRAMLGMERKQD